MTRREEGDESEFEPGEESELDPQQVMQDMIAFAQSKMQTQSYVDFVGLLLRVKEDHRRTRDSLIAGGTPFPVEKMELSDVQAIDRTFELMDLVLARWRARAATHKHPEGS